MFTEGQSRLRHLLQYLDNNHIQLLFIAKTFNLIPPGLMITSG